MSGAPTGNNGNIGSITDTLNGSRTQSFTYDGLNRIGSFSLGGTLNQQYAIDSFGNLSGVVGGSATTSFDPSTNRTSNLPCSASTPAYDAAGNQTCDSDPNGAVRVYKYDGVGRTNQIAMLGNTANPFETYAYLGDSRIRKSSPPFGTFTEYVGFNGEPIAEKDQAGTWADYIFAGGKRIAKTGTSSMQIHFGGLLNMGYVMPFNGVVIQKGDVIAWRQMQRGPAVPRGGLGMFFGDGTETNWITQDQNGEAMNNLSTQNAWVYRVVDLSAHAGKTVTMSFINNDSYSGAGNWDEYFSDIAFSRADGTVIPIYNGQPSAGYTANGSSGVTNSTFAVEQVADSNQMNTTHFYIGDHLGSAQMEFTASGWPASSSQFAPYGGEINPQPTTNRYKFTGKERDAESGLDYFGARYYASNMGRFMSTDPHSGTVLHILNPQRWNMYSYGLNNPLSFTDPTGMDAVAVNFSGMVAGLGHEGILSINSDGSAQYARFGPSESV